jgi:hypothetical protein
VFNRPGLQAIAFRAGTYSSFRLSMLQRIAGMPALSALQTRSDDDYAITLLDMWATIADILTFYQERVANEGYLARFLRTSLVDDGEATFFANVHSLLPSHSLYVSFDGQRARMESPIRYWEFHAERARATYNYDDPATQFRELLEDSIRLRLRADVPVGTCLSGGLDSSSIVALASRQLRGPVWTFSASSRRIAVAVLARARTRFLRPLERARVMARGPAFGAKAIRSVRAAASASGRAPLKAVMWEKRRVSAI